MKITLHIILLLALAQLAACNLNNHEADNHYFKAPLTIVMIRHGEKPKSGDNLSCQGLNRALALPQVLKDKIGIPDYVYTPSIDNDDETRHVRMLQTVTPFAVKYNLSINSYFKAKQIDLLSEDVLRKNGTVLIVWSHSEMPKIAKKLGIDHPPKWKKKDYDKIWIITHNKDKTTFREVQQMLKPAQTCIE